MVDPASANALTVVPATFRGRASARGTQYGVMAFFVVMALATTSLLFMKPFWSGAIPIVVIGDLLWFLMIGLVVQSLSTIGSTIHVDARGLTLDGDRRIAWTDIVQADLTEPRTDTWRLRVRDEKPVTLRLYLIQDGKELGRIIAAQTARNMTSLDEAIVGRPAGLGLMIAMAVLLFGMWAAILPSSLHTPPKPGALVHPAVINFGVLGVYVLLLLDRLTSFFRLSGSTLTVGSLYRKQSIEVWQIQRLTATQTGNGLIVEGGPKPIQVGPNYTNLDRLKARLTNEPLSPLGERGRGEGKGSLPESPKQLPKEALFGPKPNAWIGPLFMLLVAAALTGMGVYLIFAYPDAGQKGIGVFCALLFGSCGAGSIAYLLLSRTSYAIDPSGIERRSPTGVMRMEWKTLTDARRTGSDQSGYRLKAATKKMQVEASLLQDPQTLMAAIDEHTASLRVKQVGDATGRAFGMERGQKTMIGIVLGAFGVLCSGFGLYYVFGGGQRAGHSEDQLAGVVLGCMYLTGGLFMILLTAKVLVDRYVPYPDRLEVRTLRGQRTLQFSQLRRVELGTQLQSKSNTVLRTLTLEHPNGDIRLTSNVGDFAILTDYILAHVDPAIVRDERPPGG